MVRIVTMKKIILPTLQSKTKNEKKSYLDVV